MFVVLLLAIPVLLCLVDNWIRRVFAYLRRNFTRSGYIDTLIPMLEQMEHRFYEHAAASIDDASLPEGVPQRVARVPGLIRK